MDKISTTEVAMLMLHFSDTDSLNEVYLDDIDEKRISDYKLSETGAVILEWLRALKGKEGTLEVVLELLDRATSDNGLDIETPYYYGERIASKIDIADDRQFFYRLITEYLINWASAGFDNQAKPHLAEPIVYNGAKYTYITTIAENITDLTSVTLYKLKEGE